MGIWSDAKYAWWVEFELMVEITGQHKVCALPIAKVITELKCVMLLLFTSCIVVVLLCAGRKSGKGCYVYSGRKGKNKTVNQEAEKLLEKYRIPVRGRYIHTQCHKLHSLPPPIMIISLPLFPLRLSLDYFFIILYSL